MTVAVAAVAMASTLTACGPGGEETDSSNGVASTSAEAFGVETVPEVAKLVPADLKGKTLTNGIYNNYPPEYFVEDGQLKGVQVDLTNAVAATAGLKIRHSPVGSFDSLIPGMVSGRYDFSSGDFGITKERVAQADFVSHWDMGTSFLTKKGSDISIERDTDICGLEAGVEKGSYYVEQIEALNDECTAAGLESVDLTTFPSDVDALLAVGTGRIEVTGGTTDWVAYVSQEQGNQFEVGSLEYEPVPLGFGFPKDSQLVKVFQAALQEMIRNGVYQKVLEKWDLQDSAYSKPESVRINPLTAAQE